MRKHNVTSCRGVGADLVAGRQWQSQMSHRAINASAQLIAGVVTCAGSIVSTGGVMSMGVIASVNQFAAAQTLPPLFRLADVKQLALETGLANPFTSSAIRGPDGALHVGSTRGLLRWNGLEFESHIAICAGIFRRGCAKAPCV